MDVAELRAIYTATSQDFDRVTDHVQRRLKETQAVAGGAGGAAPQAAKQAADAQLSIFKTIEQGRQAFVKSNIDAAEKDVQATVKTTQAVAKGAAEEAAVRKRFMATIEAGRQEFVTSQIKLAETEAKGIVDQVQKTAQKVKQTGTAAFDQEAFWQRQGRAASNAAKVTETATKDAAKTVEGAWITEAEREAAIQARRAANATRVGKTVVTDVATGAKLTSAELEKLVGKGSKVVTDEAAKVKTGVSKALGDLQTLFLRNNFLFRQLGQRAVGDLGFAAVGVTKLAVNFKQLAASEGGVAAELAEVTAGASSALGVFVPLGVTVGVVTVGVVALAAATVGAAAGLFLMAKSVSDTEEHFADLNRQTGLSTDNLQALDVASKQSGTTLDRLNTSIGQLERKLIDASEGGTSRLSAGLRRLGIDAEDPNKALNQLVDLLGKLPAGTVRTGAAMQIFGRGGKDVAGVIGEIVEQVGNADGALDRFKKQLVDSGIHINSDGVESAANLHKELVLLEAQFESIKRVVGEEAIPVVLDAVTRFSDSISRNRVQIGEWAKDLVHAAERVIELAQEIGKLAAFIQQFNPLVMTVRIVTSVSGALSQGITPEQRAKAIIGAGVGEGIGTGVGVGVGGRQPQQFFEQGEVPQPLPGIAPTNQADAIAKKIRDAFAQAPRGGRGRQGEDPGQIAKRLAEIELREVLKGIEARQEALDRGLNRNLISEQDYAAKSIENEKERSKKTLEGLQAEFEATKAIRKPGARLIAQKEINARIEDEQRRSKTALQKIDDDEADRQLRMAQSAAESHIRVVETQTNEIKAKARELADFRIITNAQAAHIEEEQELRLFELRRQKLEEDRDNTKLSIEKRAEATQKLDELAAELKAFQAASGRHISDELRHDADDAVQFAARIREAFARATAARLDAAEANLEPLRNSILTRRQLWDAELRIEIEREKQRHELVVKALEDEAAGARLHLAEGTQQLKDTLASINAQIEADEKLHQARLDQLATQRAEQRRQELLQVADDLASIASDIFDAIGKSSEEFWKALSQTATNFAKQIRDQLFKGFLEKVITGQATGSEGLIGAIINPLLGARGPNAAVADNTKATIANTAAINAHTRAIGGTPVVAGGVSGVLQFLPSLFGGSRQSGGPVDSGHIYRIHSNEFFRPNVSGRIYNLDQMSGMLNQSNEVRTIVALGDDAVGEAMESHRLTPQGRRAAIVRGRWNRKTGGLQFA